MITATIITTINTTINTTIITVLQLLPRLLYYYSTISATFITHGLLPRLYYYHHDYHSISPQILTIILRYLWPQFFYNFSEPLPQLFDYFSTNLATLVADTIGTSISQLLHNKCHD
jgi:hypothetical protein